MQGFCVIHPQSSARFRKCDSTPNGSFADGGYLCALVLVRGYTFMAHPITAPYGDAGKTVTFVLINQKRADLVEGPITKKRNQVQLQISTLAFNAFASCLPQVLRPIEK